MNTTNFLVTCATHGNRAHHQTVGCSNVTKTSRPAADLRNSAQQEKAAYDELDDADASLTRAARMLAAELNAAILSGASPERVSAVMNVSLATYRAALSRHTAALHAVEAFA